MNFTLDAGGYFLCRRRAQPARKRAGRTSGTLWVSDNSCGVTRIDRTGSRPIGAMGGNPNGLAMAKDGSLFVANVIDGALYRLRRDGLAKP